MQKKRAVIYVRSATDADLAEKLEHQEIMCMQRAQENVCIVVQGVCEVISAYQNICESRRRQRAFELARRFVHGYTGTWRKNDDPSSR